MPINRKEYEFTPITKREAKKRAGGKCEICGRKTDLDCHHLLPIELTEFYPEIAATVIASLDNLIVLCHHCHSRMGRHALKNHPIIAEKLRKLCFTQEKIPGFDELLNPNLQDKLPGF